jgi:hypothetical protein
MAVSGNRLALPPGLLDRLQSALGAVRAARAAPGAPTPERDRAGRPAAAAPAALAPRAPSAPVPRAETPSAPVPRAETPAPAPRAVIFVTVFGLSTSALEEVLDLVAREGQGKPVSPVFLTDSLEFKPFRERRLRFEYIPDGGRRQQFAPDLDWQTYERRRYHALAEKWRPQSLISFGTPPPPDCVAAVRALRP